MEYKSDGINLSFNSVGSEDVDGVSGEKPPIILLHGVTNAKETWQKVLLPIAQLTGRKVYAYDARNHGDSSWSNTLDYGVMQDDLFRFMQGLPAQKAILIGHSMGGKTAMYFSLKWPEKVEKLIIEDISPKTSSDEIRVMARKYITLLRHALNQIPESINDIAEAKQFVDKYIQDAVSKISDSSNETTSDSELLPLTQDEDGKFRWKANLEVIEESFIKGSHRNFLKGQCPSPALILWGTKSPYAVTEDRDFILQHFPRARFRAVVGASHQIHLLFKDIFLKEVAHFINEAR